MKLITPKDYDALGRVYCKYCTDNHHFDLTKVSSEAYGTDYWLSFNYKNIGSRLFDRWRDRERLLDLAKLKETIEGVSCDIKQVKQIIELLPESQDDSIDLKWSEIDEFFALAIIFEDSEMVVTLELVKSSGVLYFESVNFCYKLPAGYSKKELRRDYWEHLIYNRAIPFYSNEVILEDDSAKRLQRALLYVYDNLGEKVAKIGLKWEGEKPPEGE